MPNGNSHHAKVEAACLVIARRMGLRDVPTKEGEMSDPPSQVECYKCGKLFTPDPEKLKAWGESDQDFDPTDWECPACIAQQDAYWDDEDDDWDLVEDADDWDERCPDCGLLYEDCDCGVPVEDDEIDPVTDAQIEDGEHRPDGDPDVPF